MSTKKRPLLLVEGQEVYKCGPSSIKNKLEITRYFILEANYELPRFSWGYSKLHQSVVTITAHVEALKTLASTPAEALRKYKELIDNTNSARMEQIYGEIGLLIDESERVRKTPLKKCNIVKHSEYWLPCDV